MPKIRKISFEVNEELASLLEAALELTEEDQNEIFERSISQYVKNVFLKENTRKKETSSNNIIGSSGDNDKKQFKAKTRIPRWAFRKKQINHKIIKAFLEIEKEKGRVNILDLENRCLNSAKQDTYVKTFSLNFASMKTDAGNSHGKVFEEDYRGLVTVWEPIKEVFIQYKDKF